MAATEEAVKPDVKPEDASSLPEVPEKYKPGEMAPAEGLSGLYGFRNELLPENYQNVLRSLVQKIAQIDMFARIDEVKRATEGRFYWRTMFDVYFNETSSVWEDSSSNADAGDVPLTYGFNIYASFGRGFITEVGIPPSIKFIATNPANPDANRISSSADAMRQKIEFQNHTDVLAEEVARYMWTDGRTCLYSRWVCDGSRFGYDEETHVDEQPEGLGEGGKPPEKKPRQPKGGEVLSAYGVLEAKIPINMRQIEDFPFIQLSYEIDLAAAKSMYPYISANISGGEPGPGEYNFDRTSRIATTQGIRLLTQTGDTIYQLPTYQRTWIRASFYANIDDDTDRKFIENNFPDGCMVAFVGETYAESRNENMDDHWSICRPIQGDGQATKSAGYDIMAVQDAFNDLTDLQMETFMKSIPAIFGDKAIFDFAAMSKQKAGPGAHWPTKRDLQPTEDINHKIFAEPFPSLDTGASAFYTLLLGGIPQFITGLYPATLGDADPNNETKGGVLALRDASKGQQGVAWKAFRSAYAKSMEQLVKIGAYYRASEAEDGKVEINSPGNVGTLVDLEDLHDGNFYCVPDGDESYPRTHEDEQQSFNTLVAAASAGNAGAAAILNEPKNSVVWKEILAMPDVVIPGADETEKQMSEITELLESVPIPNTPAIAMFTAVSQMALKTGKPAPPKPPMQTLYRPSVDIDQDFDIHDIEFKAGNDWVNSPAGRQAKVDNPQGFLNVRLHLLLHKAAMNAAAQNQAKTALTAATMPKIAIEQAKAAANKTKPSESINFKDLGPSGQVQLGHQAGLDLTADAAADVAGEGMDQNQEKPAA